MLLLAIEIVFEKIDKKLPGYNLTSTKYAKQTIKANGAAQKKAMWIFIGLKCSPKLVLNCISKALNKKIDKNQTKSNHK